MDGNSSSNSQAGSKNFVTKPKSITPSVLGMAYSHGVKFSLNMTSEDKRDLMSKLEEWRRARKDKLAARILTRQKQFEKPKSSVPVPTPKNRPLSLQNEGAPKIQDRQSVFERLYNNTKEKTKKRDDGSGSRKTVELLQTTPGRQFGFTSEGGEGEVQVSHTDTDETHTTSATEEEHESLGKKSIAEVSEHYCDSIEGNPLGESVRASVEEPPRVDTQLVAVPLERSNQVESVKTEPRKTDLVAKDATSKFPVTSAGPQKRKNSLRRSVSMMFRQKCRNEYAVRRSFSAKNLKELSLGQQRLNRVNMPTAPRPAGVNVKEGKSGTKSVSFATQKHIKPFGSKNLRTKLEDWLKVNGHSLEGYRHLRCFGVATCEKSRASTAPLPLDHSFETSCRTPIVPNTAANDSDKENLTPPTVVNYQVVDTRDAENWLKELHRLIVEVKYPPERCEEWLTAIRKKCSACSQLPIFWECLAALHESKGDLTSAIEDYERAIIKGGEVDSVGDSLAQLFEKMVVEERPHSKTKMEKGIDPKNIFKSTIIKFALQQKALKELSSELDPSVRQQLYVATPVRRSTRIQTPHKSGREVASLQTLTPELRKNVIFKPNESLLRGD